MTGSLYLPLIFAWALLAPLLATAKGVAEHVVIVVWDGMRPDFITPQHTPVLYGLAQDGVFFRNHHPAYVSSTEVNGTAIATGMHPDHSGIMANSDYRPEIGWLSPGGTESVDVIRRVDLLTGGKFITVPTVAEILHENGIPTIIAGTKPIALLHDRANRRTTAAETNSVVLYKGQTIPRSVLAGLVKLNEDKQFPTNTTHPNTAPDAWTTKSLVHGLWKKGVPKYTLLWLSDPDASQHEFSPGSEAAISALANCDRNLYEVMKGLDDKKLFEKTDIMVVSDHGFSTIKRNLDLSELLKKHRFKAGRKLEDTEAGDVMVVGLGGHFGKDVVVDKDRFLRAAFDVDQLMTLVDRELMGGGMPISLYDYVRRGVSAQTAPADRVIAALYLTAISPQFQVIE